MQRNKNDWLTGEVMMKVRKHARHINKVRMSFMDVGDIEQDLLCEVCEAIKSFDSERGNISAFVESVLANRAKNYLRQRFALKRGRDIFFEPFEENNDFEKRIADFGQNAENASMKKIDLERAEKCLSPIQFRIYVFLKNHSITEIANFLNVPYTSLHFRVQKIRKCIKNEINSEKSLSNSEHVYWVRPENMEENM